MMNSNLYGRLGAAREARRAFGPSTHSRESATYTDRITAGTVLCKRELKSVFNWSFMTSTILCEKNRTESSAYSNKSHSRLVTYHLHKRMNE